MIDRRIGEQRKDIIERWRSLCRFRTTADNLPECRKAADWLLRQLEPVFDETGMIPVEGQGPVVYGIVRGASDSTLMLYNHYDAVPAGDESRWTHPPYAAEIHDGVMWARGACDDKADAAGRIDSFRLWRQEHEQAGRPLPYTVIYFAEAAEEIGSPGLDGVLREHADLFRSDACLWESYLREEDGSPAIGYGCRGSLVVRLSLHVLKDDIHPSYGSVVRNAPIELMQVIAALRDADGLVAVPGMRELAMTPSPAALERVRRVSVPSESLRLDAQVSPNPSASPEELSRRFIFEPGMSLASFDLDPSSERVIPAACSATVRFSLVPGMEPDRCLALICNYVHELNPDAVVEKVSDIAPAFSSPDSVFGRSVAEAAGEAFGHEPVIYDVMTGAGPGAVFLDRIGAPIASPTGTLRPDGNMHGYDEHGNCDDYLAHVDFTLRLLRRLESNGF